MSRMSRCCTETSDGVTYQENRKTAVAIALPEIEVCTSIAVQKLLLMVNLQVAFSGD